MNRGISTQRYRACLSPVSRSHFPVRCYAEDSKLTYKFKGTKTIDDVLVLTQDKLYFPRVRHLQLIQNIIDSNKPQGNVPVIGPPSVGKSTFLRNALKGRLTAHIDLRKHGVVTTVDDFIRVLQRQFQTWEAVSHEISDRFKSLFGGMQLFGVDVPKKEQSQMDVKNFTQLLRLLDELLSDIKTLHKPEKLPVLFLDDAHKLYNLLEQPMGREVLTTFFDWCVSITKADKLCHVIVACSDGLFVRWLQNEFGLASHLRTVLVSDLSKPKAFQFVELCLNMNKEGDEAKEELSEERKKDIEKVYSVVGGNIYHLRTWALDFLSGISAETALATLVANSERQIRDAFSPNLYIDTYLTNKHKALWTTGHWLTILKALAASTAGYLPYYKVLHEVFNGNAAVLHSLIHLQLLHYRPTHIRSVAMQADPDDQFLVPVIGVPSTVFLYATKKVLKSLPNPIIMISVVQAGKEGYVDIAIPPEKFNTEDIRKLISKEFAKQPEEIQSIIIESSKTEVRREYDLNKLVQYEKLKVEFIPKTKSITDSKRGWVSLFSLGKKDSCRP
eukprot:Phypoly_transcript_05890.p1 GENE.Phypoly_transcript_05890~~Phypoly_transcript_05890.p1  ORF type:complete len:558 (+),score=58.38 Phypoly_transcript_05890:140-1813(+)